MHDIHEIRDPIHNFILFDDDEKDLLKLWPIQRLRDLSQLGTCHYVYPSCTHKRFEHSLGVMELVSRIFDKVTFYSNQPDNIRKSKVLPNKDYKLLRDRQLVRVAALCHDIGHLPFSHSLESLLPDGNSHEHITYRLITETSISDYIKDVIKDDPKRVAAIAIGNKINSKINKGFSDSYTMDAWDMILSSMITSDHFGADRIDYLVRDSHHAGVAYGRFDYHRLIDCLSLVKSPEGEIEIGIDEGGIHAVESLLIARYFLFSQVCYHPVKIIYEKHITDFCSGLMENKKIEIENIDHFKKFTEGSVIEAMNDAYFDESNPLNGIAKIINERGHYRCIFNRELQSTSRVLKNETHDLVENILINKQITNGIYELLSVHFNEPNVYQYLFYKADIDPNWMTFPVKKKNGEIVQPYKVSQILNKQFPKVGCFYVYVNQNFIAQAEPIVKKHLESGGYEADERQTEGCSTN